MSLEFSEYRCKKKYKSKRRNIPVFRVLVLLSLIFVAFKLGWISKLVELLPLPGNEKVEVIKTWQDLCREAGGKPFNLKDELVQCSWVVDDSTKALPNAFLRYVASLRTSRAEKLHWVASAEDFENAILVQREDSLVYTYFRVILSDSNYVWIDAATGCRFPGLCPKRPLEWSNIPVMNDFDFEGQDRLLAEDVFLGLGEAPVHPVLPGVVRKAGRDSLGAFIEIDHGNNIFTKMSGISFSPSEGDSLDLNSVVGRLPPKDSAAFFLTVRRNGLFVRWNDFYKAAYPVDSAEISKFKEQIGFR
ncbi:hypothetical protein SAMN05720471_12711 [Fibrobacter sp. UWP2]|nr:hypothetical protein SAMN05720471_12711 [Fibrobacter sp. UWP2]